MAAHSTHIVVPFTTAAPTSPSVCRRIQRRASNFSRLTVASRSASLVTSMRHSQPTSPFHSSLRSGRNTTCSDSVPSRRLTRTSSPTFGGRNPHTRTCQPALESEGFFSQIPRLALMSWSCHSHVIMRLACRAKMPRTPREELPNPGALVPGFPPSSHTSRQGPRRRNDGRRRVRTPGGGQSADRIRKFAATAPFRWARG